MSETITLEKILAPGGIISARLARYEPRLEQIEMAQAVERAFQQSRHLAVEAGTGVGKSFAYLVPAILHATADQVRDFTFLPETATETLAIHKENFQEETSSSDMFAADSSSEDSAADAASQEPDFRRVVISTHTISLQEQLFEKDIPFLRSILPFEFSAVLVKGRANYLCRRRFQRALQKVMSIFEDDHTELMDRLVKWVNQTEDGSRSDLSKEPPKEVWSEICCDPDNCLGTSCLFREKCFYNKARRRIEHAEILIVNHALLFSDLALRRTGGGMLPLYKMLIFDEAHTMEQVATDHLGVSITQGQVDYLLGRLYSDRTSKGLLSGHPKQYREAIERVQECGFRAEELFSDLLRYLEQYLEGNGRIFKPNIVNNGLSEALQSLDRQLRLIAEKMEDANDRKELAAARKKLETLGATLQVWMTQSDSDYVYWLERRTTKGRTKVEMHAAPIDVGPILREQLFSKTSSVIMTSATLSIKGTKNNIPTAEETEKAFTFFRSRIGLTQVDSVQLGSPFDYREQLTLVLIKNFPEPNDFNDAYLQKFQISLKKYLLETDGGAFVLFTNYTFLRKMSAELLPWLAEQNMPFYSQADGIPRTQMVEQFKTNRRSVLFGTDSFWQGVDIPGEGLRNIIITKLPFFVPDHPLSQARLESITQRGGSPFNEYQLPHAILKFKQGFGRLIRSRSDEGLVIVMDSRIHTKGYGRSFLESLPDCRLRIDVAK